MEVVLSRNSALGAIKAPADLVVNVNGEFFLIEECAPLWSSGTLVPLTAGFRKLGDKAYPANELRNVRTSRSASAEMHVSMTPDLVTCNDGTFCLNPAVAEACGYRNVDGTWMVVHDNDGYHSGRRSDFSKSDSIYRVGFEIEKEDTTLKKKYPAIVVKKLGWAKERDGSLSEESGYELVSPVYDLFESRLEEDIDKHPVLQELINGKYSNRCGGHINISCTNCSVHDLFSQFKAYYPLLYAMYPKRTSVGACQARKSNDMLRGGKYSAVHCKDYALEFRIFPAVHNVTDLIWRLNFMRFMANTRISDFETIPKLLTEGTSLYTLMKEGGFDIKQLVEGYNTYSKTHA